MEEAIRRRRDVSQLHTPQRLQDLKTTTDVHANSTDRQRWRDEARRLLPTFDEAALPSAIPAPEVTKIALKLRYLIEECVPCELEESHITCSHSRIITQSVVKAAKEAGGSGYAA
jgi:hypothetical protein